MRISVWSSDGCSSDLDLLGLAEPGGLEGGPDATRGREQEEGLHALGVIDDEPLGDRAAHRVAADDRARDVERIHEPGEVARPVLEGDGAIDALRLAHAAHRVGEVPVARDLREVRSPRLQAGTDAVRPDAGARALPRELVVDGAALEPDARD